MCIRDRPLDVGGLGLVAEDAVLPERGLQQQTVPVAVLRDVADPGLPDLADLPVGDVGALQENLP